MRHLPDLPRHWRADSGPHRLILGRRLDGIELALDLPPEGAPVFLAIFPMGGVPTSAVLEDAATVADAVAQVEERWPGSPWMTEGPGSREYGPGAGAHQMIPLMGHGGHPFTVVEFTEEDANASLRLISQPISYAAFRVVGYRTRVRSEGDGMHTAVVDWYGLPADKNLLYGPQVAQPAPESVADDAEAPAPPAHGADPSECYGLRHCPILQPNNYIEMSLTISGTIGRCTVEAAAIVEAIWDPAGTTEGEPFVGHAPRVGHLARSGPIAPAFP